MNALYSPKRLAAASLGLSLAFTCWTAPVRAATIDVLFDFTAAAVYCCGDLTPIVSGPDHALYGDSGGGIFRLAPNAGSWTYTLLYDPPSGHNDFMGPFAFDASGALYAQSYGDGASDLGTFFKLIPKPSGPWPKKDLFTFIGQGTGKHPQFGLVADKNDNFYGVTENASSGILYRFSRRAPGSDRWKQTVLYRFEAGSIPVSELTPDGSGGFYGIVTRSDGTWAYQLENRSSVKWRLTTIYRFADDAPGRTPRRLIRAPGGELYGMAPGQSYGFKPPGGYVFKLEDTGGGRWEGTILHKFKLNSEGYGFTYGLALHKSGILYGVTGGKSPGPAVIFSLTPPATNGGAWTYDVLRLENPGAFSNMLTTPGGAIYGVGRVSECDCLAAFRLKP